MSESAGVRLVRCPNCENLLPELTEFSVYQCGGCGAVLRANDNHVELDTFSEDSYEDRVGRMKRRFPARYESYDHHKVDLYQKRMMGINDGYDTDRMSKISSSSRTEVTVFPDRNENFRHGLMSKEEKWDYARNASRGMSSDGRRVAREFENLTLYDEIEDRWERSSGVVRSEGYPVRSYANSIFSEESGYSNHMSSPRHGYGFPIKNSYNRDVFDVGDEMDQLIRSGNLADRGKEKAYQNRYSENVSLMHRHELAGNGLHRPRFPSSRVQEPSMARRGPFQASSRSHPYASGSYRDDEMVYLNQNVIRHHPSCSCFQCCSLRQGPPPVQTAICRDEYSDVSVESRYSYPENPVSSDQRSYNSRPTRMHLPIAGGAPFILCVYCFEVLLLPKCSDSTSKVEIRRKIKCGMCSKVVVFTFSDKKLVFRMDAETSNAAAVKVDENGKREAYSTDEYDGMGCDFQAMDREPEQVLSVKAGVSDSVQTKHRFSASTHTTDLEEDTESETESENVQRETSNQAARKDVIKEHPPRAGASLQEHFEYSNIFRAKNRQGEGNTSGNSKQGKHLSKTSIASQISVNSTLATETDVSSNDLSNTGTSFDSGYASGKGRRHQQSVFASIMKRSVKESNNSKQNAEPEKASVMVNGHAIPDEMIKKAEKVAGPISQGSYWYDHRAGFWGAMGGPCLGMIPPGIEEFNYPMPEKCSDGNTDILVNGRELNQKDMNLLRRRGLPADRNRSYKVEISGRIIDKDTGEELQSLGKLAPTIERIRRGFGMRVPKPTP